MVKKALPLGVVLLLTTTTVAQDRYFTAETRTGSARFLWQQDEDILIFGISRAHAELDITIDYEHKHLFEGGHFARPTLTIHEASFSYQSRIFEVNGGTLDFSVDVEMPQVILPLSRDKCFDCVITSEPVDPSRISISGTYRYPTISFFDYEFTLDTAGEVGSFYQFFLKYDSDGQLLWIIDSLDVTFHNRYPLRVGGDAFLSPLSIWVCCGNDAYEDLQHVPTAEERATYLLGDVNLDGDVTFADFLKLSSKFGGRGTWGHGDFNGDFQVDFADFLLLSGNFGKSISNTAASVPEPSSIASVSFAFVLLSLRKRSR